MYSAPGTILQRQYLRVRFKRRAIGRFIEVGAGRGDLSRELLDLGWRGDAWDISEDAVAHASELNRNAISEGRYVVRRGDWLEQSPGPADLVVSSMVLEHMPDGALPRDLPSDRRRARAVRTSLSETLGIEDEIAGHLRRYTRESLCALLARCGYEVKHLAGLTFPLSNILLPLSNLLVRRAEGHRSHISVEERTRLSGVREVPLKTTFPAPARIILNDLALWPFAFLQALTRSSERALVLYVEASPTIKPS